MTPHPSFHLAQINIARMRAALEDPIMDGFTRQIEFLNACAERSPGFVWRLQDEAGDATSIAVFDDPELLVNLTVRESVEALSDYVDSKAHGPRHSHSPGFPPDARGTASSG